MHHANQSPLPEIPVTQTSEQDPFRMELEARRASFDERFQTVEVKDVMDIDAGDFIDGIELGGVATFMEEALKSRMTIFL